jgi:hypothetical protein
MSGGLTLSDFDGAAELWFERLNDPEALITGTAPLEHAEETFQALAEPNHTHVKDAPRAVTSAPPSRVEPLARDAAVELPPALRGGSRAPPPDGRDRPSFPRPLRSACR